MMQVSQVSKVAVVISPSWPNITTGYGIAIRASLLVYERFFDKIFFVCLSGMQYSPLSELENPAIEWVHIPVDDSALWVRFLKSLVFRKPAITIRYYLQNEQVMRIVRSTLKRCPKNSAVIFEDVPVAVFLSGIIDEFPKVRTAIRSHNLTVKAFEPLCRVGSLARRVAWRYEVSKIAKFEALVCSGANTVWSISDDDALGYMRALSIEVNGVMGVCLDVKRYVDVPFGEAKTVVCVGTADLRKGSSLTKFVSQIWPIVRGEFPDAQLVLAGKGTELYTDCGAGIQGRGFVEDDRDILGIGAIFINPQLIGAGVQLKSIVAMLAGKALVSTKLGVEGVEGLRGVDFFVSDSSREMASAIIVLMKNKDLAQDMGRHARACAMRKYGCEEYVADSLPLLVRLMDGKPGMSNQDAK